MLYHRFFFMNPRKYCFRLPIIFVILYAGIIYNLLSWNLFRLMSQSIWKFLKRCWKHFKGYEQMHKQHYTALKLEDEFCIQQKEWNVNSFAIFWFAHSLYLLLFWFWITDRLLFLNENSGFPSHSYYIMGKIPCDYGHALITLFICFSEVLIKNSGFRIFTKFNFLK